MNLQGNLLINQIKLQRTQYGSVLSCFQFFESLQQQDKVIPGIKMPWLYCKESVRTKRMCLFIERVCHEEPWLLPYAALKKQALEQPQAQHSLLVTSALFTFLVSRVPGRALITWACTGAQTSQTILVCLYVLVCLPFVAVVGGQFGV